jgi:hypothetical protein
VVAGIASSELYAAIVDFERQNFPSQHLGFFDPGGPMFKKLETLGTPAPAPQGTTKLPPMPTPPCSFMKWCMSGNRATVATTS